MTNSCVCFYGKKYVLLNDILAAASFIILKPNPQTNHVAAKNDDVINIYYNIIYQYILYNIFSYTTRVTDTGSYKIE